MAEKSGYTFGADLCAPFAVTLTIDVSQVTVEQFRADLPRIVAKLGTLPRRYPRRGAALNQTPGRAPGFLWPDVALDCSNLATWWLHRIGYLRAWPLDGANFLICWGDVRDSNP